MQIVDIVVHPDFQGIKLGRKIMESVMGFIMENANESTFVNFLVKTIKRYLGKGYTTYPDRKGFDQSVGRTYRAIVIKKKLLSLMNLNPKKIVVG